MFCFFEVLKMSYNLGFRMKGVVYYLLTKYLVVFIKKQNT